MDVNFKISVKPGKLSAIAAVQFYVQYSTMCEINSK